MLILYHTSYQHQFCKGEKKKLSKLCSQRSEQLCIMLRRGLATKLKRHGYNEHQGIWRCIMSVEISFPQSCLFIVCPLTQISDSIVKLKIGWKIGKSTRKTRRCRALHLIQQSKQTDGIEDVSEPSVSSKLHYLCADRRWIKRFLCHCVCHYCYSFIMWGWNRYHKTSPATTIVRGDWQ